MKKQKKSKARIWAEVFATLVLVVSVIMLAQAALFPDVTSTNPNPPGTPDSINSVDGFVFTTKDFGILITSITMGDGVSDEGSGVRIGIGDAAGVGIKNWDDVQTSTLDISALDCGAYGAAGCYIPANTKFSIVVDNYGAPYNREVFGASTNTYGPYPGTTYNDTWNGFPVLDWVEGARDHSGIGNNPMNIKAITFTVNVTSINFVTLVSPTDGEGVFSSPVEFNASLISETDENYNITAATINIWNSLGALFYQNTVGSIGMDSSMKQDLVVYYNFDEASGDLIDRVTGTYNGTVTDGGGNMYGYDGVQNQSYQFNQAENDYVGILSGNLTSTYGDTEVTVSMWVNITDINCPSGNFVIAEGNDASYTGWVLQHNNAETLWWRGMGGLGHNVGAVVENQWYHFVGTYNGTDTKSYLDGVLTNSSSQAYAPSEFHIDNIGSQGDSDQNMCGAVDETGIWNRTLSQTEVTSLYNSGNGLFYSAGNELSGTTNSTNWSVALTPGSYTWNVLGAFTNGTDNDEVWGLTNYSLFYGFAENSVAYNTTRTETETGTYILNASLFEAPDSVKLVYNGTEYTPTVTSDGTNNIYTNTFDTPLVPGTRSLYWNFDFGASGEINTSSNSQTVSLLNMSIMDFPYTVPFINFTFINETVAKESVTALIPRGEFTYYAGTGSVTKTFSHTEASEYTNVTLAVTPPDKTITLVADLDYDNAESQQRSFAKTYTTLTNSTTEQELYLLPTNDGIFVTFQVINTAEQPISGASVSLAKTDGTVVSQTTTGGSGTTNVFLNPNSQYILNVTKSGYTAFSVTQAFPTTEFTINLGSASTVSTNFLAGVTVFIQPKTTTILNNNTDVDFSITTASTIWNLDSYGFTILNSTRGVIGSNSTSVQSNGGTISLTANTGDNTAIYMDYFVQVNGSYFNVTASYGVDEFTKGSITGFFSRLNAYLDADWFGSENSTGGTSFLKSLVVFMIAFLTIGGLSYKFGLRSPESITTIAFAIIFVFDVGFGFLTILGVKGMATLFAGLAWLALMLRRFV